MVNHGNIATIHAALGAWHFNSRERRDPPRSPSLATVLAAHIPPVQQCQRLRRTSFYNFSSQPGSSLVSSGVRQHAAYIAHAQLGSTDIYRFRAFDLNQCSCEGKIISSTYLLPGHNKHDTVLLAPRVSSLFVWHRFRTICRRGKQPVHRAQLLPMASQSDRFQWGVCRSSRVA